jgi:hypothetical protein
MRARSSGAFFGKAILPFNAASLPFVRLYRHVHRHHRCSADAQALRSRRQTEHAGRRGSSPVQWPCRAILRAGQGFGPRNLRLMSFSGEAGGSGQAGSGLERLKRRLLGESRSAVQGSEPALLGADRMLARCPQLYALSRKRHILPPNARIQALQVLDPHRCRGCPTNGAVACSATGSSPRVRGTHLA